MRKTAAAAAVTAKVNPSEEKMVQAKTASWVEPKKAKVKEKMRKMAVEAVAEATAKVNPSQEEVIEAKTELWLNPKKAKTKEKTTKMVAAVAEAEAATASPNEEEEAKAKTEQSKGKATVIPAKRRLVKSMILDFLLQCVAPKSNE
ncbi:hypothetical protein OWV82_024124 [Melia azedarach]|uniref:Uncharacterized protein n=1 Tax=Melia azedarach TaxID=155640 RepID=A0ACC1WNX0_MELAZ|nr:hypothetical protein OWV82_024124 [Melia azedarach]